MIMQARRLTLLAAFTIGLFVACAVAVSTAKAQDTTTAPRHNGDLVTWGADTTIPVHTIYIAAGSKAMHKLDVAMVTTKTELLFIATDIRGYAEDESTVDSVFEINDVRPCTVTKAGPYSIDDADCGKDTEAPTIHLHLWRHDCGPSRTDLRSQIEAVKINPRHRVDLTYCGFNTGGSAYWVSRNPLDPSRWRGK